MKPSIRAQFEKTGYEEVTMDAKRISLESDSSGATLLEDGLHEDTRVVHVRRTPRWMWFTHAALISISAAFFVSSWFGQPEEMAYARKFSAWSPALPAVRYETLQYNFSQPSQYKGASPGVDKAWDALSFDLGDQMLTHEQFKLVNKPADSLGVTNPKTGEHGYRISIEVFHQLHCLNLLRKMTYREYYEPLGGDLGDPMEKQRKHADHCIETLRMQLMCSSDTGVITFHTKPGKEADGPEPDYNAPHVCRNFDDIRNWAVENAVAFDDV